MLTQFRNTLTISVSKLLRLELCQKLFPTSKEQIIKMQISGLDNKAIIFSKICRQLQHSTCPDLEDSQKKIMSFLGSQDILLNFYTIYLNNKQIHTTEFSDKLKNHVSKFKEVDNPKKPTTKQVQLIFNSTTF